MAIGGAAAAALWWLFAPWVPKTDFDIIGFLYLAQNGVQFLVIAALM